MKWNFAISQNKITTCYVYVLSWSSHLQMGNYESDWKMQGNFEEFVDAVLDVAHGKVKLGINIRSSAHNSCIFADTLSILMIC